MSKGVTLSPSIVEILLESPTTRTSSSASFTVQNTTNQLINLQPKAFELVAVDGVESTIADTELSKTLRLTPVGLALDPGKIGTVSAELLETEKFPVGTRQFFISLQLAEKQSGSVQSGVAGQLIVTQQKDAVYSVVPRIITRSGPYIGKLSAVDLQIEHTGNAYLRPYARVVLTDFTGREVGYGTINSESMILKPRQSLIFPAKIKYTQLTLPISNYTIEVQGRVVPSDTPFSLETKILVIDPVSSMLFSLILGLLVWWMRKTRRMGVRKELHQKPQ